MMNLKSIRALSRTLPSRRPRRILLRRPVLMSNLAIVFFPSKLLLILLLLILLLNRLVDRNLDALSRIAPNLDISFLLHS